MTEDQDPLIGNLLGGARIQRRVSQGLLANVYLGTYERLGVPVAVKVLSPKATAQGMSKERFIREGRALAQLSHPNIIKIYNVGHDQGRYFIVMDWIQDGMNLRQLAQTRPLTPAQSLKVIRRLCEALDYIHAKSLLHRDIKPANVCLRKGGHPVVMDFSLIKDQSSDVQLTAPGTIMGTVNFMPPEQAQPGGQFGQVGPWSDVYSVAGTGYWLLTGRPPFKGRTPMETIIKLIREPHAAPSSINPSIPPEVDALMAKGLAKRPEERYRSSKEFMAAIDQIFATCVDALKAGTPPALAEADDGPVKPAAPAAAAPAAAAPPARWGQSGQQAAMPAQQTAPAPAAAVAAPPGSFRGAMPMPAAAAVAPAPAIPEEEAPTVRLPPGQMSALAAASGAAAAQARAAQPGLGMSSQGVAPPPTMPGSRAAIAEQKKASSWVEDGEGASWMRNAPLGGGAAPDAATMPPARQVDGAGNPIPVASAPAPIPPTDESAPIMPVKEDTSRAQKIALPPPKKKNNTALLLLGAALVFLFLVAVGGVAIAFKMGWLHFGGGS